MNFIKKLMPKTFSFHAYKSLVRKFRKIITLFEKNNLPSLQKETQNFLMFIEKAKETADSITFHEFENLALHLESLALDMRLHDISFNKYIRGFLKDMKTVFFFLKKFPCTKGNLLKSQILINKNIAQIKEMIFSLNLQKNGSFPEKLKYGSIYRKFENCFLILDKIVREIR